MREYPVKKTIKMSYEYIRNSLEEMNIAFSNEETHIISSIPGIKRLELWTDGKKLFIETVTDTEYKNPMETVKRFNEIITKLTGYSSKERKKLISK
ncbi:MAG: DUF5611 family protein [Ferroplasma sp.]